VKQVIKGKRPCWCYYSLSRVWLIILVSTGINCRFFSSLIDMGRQKINWIVCWVIDWVFSYDWLSDIWSHLAAIKVWFREAMPNLPSGRLPDISDSSVSIYRENNELTLIYQVATLGVVLLGTYKFFQFLGNEKEIFGLVSPPGGPPRTQISDIRCPLLQLLLFSLEYASQIKS
jgi:hypothetical protein